MKRLSIIIITIVLLGANMVCAVEKSSHPFVDKVIAGIVIGEDHEEKVMKYYGKGTPVQKGFAWCFYSIDENQYIIFELGPDKIISGVTLTTEYTSECQKITNKSKKVLITSKGIQLGESLRKVLELYGSPAKKEIKDGTLILEYHTDYERDTEVRLYYDAYLYFKKDKLIKLYIHDGD